MYLNVKEITSSSSKRVEPRVDSGILRKVEGRRRNVKSCHNATHLFSILTNNQCVINQNIFLCAVVIFFNFEIHVFSKEFFIFEL